MERDISIHFIGKVSSGKSSVINAIAGGFISNVRLLRETVQPLFYNMSKNGSFLKIIELGDKLNEMHNKNMSDIKNIAVLQGKTIDLCDDTAPLPSRWGLDGINFLDCPGIDDADDNNKLFWKSVETQYYNADVLVFVTDANCAFRDASEVDLFKNIKKLVDINNKKGMWIDLVILVNKFDDDNDDDLTEIFNSIADKTDLDHDKIFKFSSYKVLIDNIIIHNEKPHIYIPNNDLYKEFNKILKANSINHKVNNDDKYCYLHIDNREIKQNDFIKYLQSSKENCNINSLKAYKSYNKIVFDELLSEYGYFTNKNILKAPQITKLQKIYEKFKYPTDLHESAMFIDIFNNFIQTNNTLTIKKNSRIRLFEFFVCVYKLYGNYNDEKICSQFLMKHMEDYDFIQTLTYVFIQLLSFESFKLLDNLFLLNKILSFPDVFDDNYDMNYYDIENKNFYSKLGKSTDSQYSWYIDNLINHPNLPNNIKYLLKLSKFSIKELIYIDKINKINYPVFDDILPQFKQNIKWISTCYINDDSNDPKLANKAFNKFKFYNLFDDYINQSHKSVHELEIPIYEEPANDLIDMNSTDDVDNPDDDTNDTNNIDDTYDIDDINDTDETEEIELSMRDETDKKDIELCPIDSEEYISEDESIQDQENDSIDEQNDSDKSIHVSYKIVNEIDHMM